MSMRDYFCDYALLPDGWRERVRLRAGADGRWVSVQPDSDSSGAISLGRYVIAGMPNLHSHAFQRAMAGSAERFGRPDDSFWTWRENMYRFAGAIDPESLYAIAAWLYVEMLERGYTRVCEFHYVHHRADGSAYAQPSAMSDALIAAARDTGIGLTLLPTLYQRGGFRNQPLVARQRRFSHDFDAFLQLLQDLAMRESAEGFRLGAAVHSLRAVGTQPLQQLLADPLLQQKPIHVHVAEQRLEVEECLAAHGRRPVEFLLDSVNVDSRFCLVHATHMQAAERDRAAASGAIAGLCPTTEANLGDGIFPLREWRASGGAWGVGSDSQIGLDPREELRWLEYQARLQSGGRTLLANASAPDVAENLWQEAVSGGARASGANAAGLIAGADADWISTDHQDPALAGHGVDSILAAWIFGPASVKLSVGVGGIEHVHGHHPQRERFGTGYAQAVTRLRAAL